MKKKTTSRVKKVNTVEPSKLVNEGITEDRPGVPDVIVIAAQEVFLFAPQFLNELVTHLMDNPTGGT